MNWLNRAEAKFGHLAIPGLVRIVVVLNALVFLLYKYNPEYLGFLSLRPDLIMKGEVWRLVTFIFIPRFGGILGDLISLIFYLGFLDFLGRGLEMSLGAFKVNVYYFLGMAGVAAAAFLFGDRYASGLLNTSLLFALNRFAPETVIYIFFILPVKLKWLAWLAAAFLILGLLTNGWDYRAPALICLANYILFFGAEHVREARLRSQVAARRERFQLESQADPTSTLHDCAVCHRTEASDPYLDFRVARDGQEYCADHLPPAAPSAA